MDAQVAELGRAEGITYDFDAALHANTFLGHRLLHLAEAEYGPAVQGQLKEALLAAHFTDGVDVGDRAALTDVAVSAGLDRERVTAYLAGDEGAAEVRAQLAVGRELGITAVPTFVFEGKWAVQGGQEAETFRKVLDQVAAEIGERRPAPVQIAPAGEACADGACAI